jgi:hypothetical protein
MLVTRATKWPPETKRDATKRAPDPGAPQHHGKTLSRVLLRATLVPAPRSDTTPIPNDTAKTLSQKSNAAQQSCRWRLRALQTRSWCCAACNRGSGRSRRVRSGASSSLAPAPTPGSKASHRHRERPPWQADRYGNKRAIDRLLALFPNGLVRRPNRTRCRGRIGIFFGRGLPGQTCEQATALAKGDGSLAGPEGFGSFFVEDVERR